LHIAGSELIIRAGNIEGIHMVGLTAIFIWLGVPLLIINAYDLEGWLWKIGLTGAFGVVALLFYGGATMLVAGVRDKNAEKENDS